MSFLSIPDAISERLTKRAIALNLTVEQLIAQLLDVAVDRGTESLPSPTEVSFDDWKKKFDAWMGDVQARASRYPPGFTMNDSRDSIYEGCGGAR